MHKFDRKKGEGRRKSRVSGIGPVPGRVVQVPPGSWSRGEILTSGPVGWESKEAFWGCQVWHNWFVTVWMVWRTTQMRSILWPYYNRQGLSHWWTYLVTYWSHCSTGSWARVLERSPRVRTAADVGRGHEEMVGVEICSGECILRKARWPWRQNATAKSQWGMKPPL